MLSIYSIAHSGGIVKGKIKKNPPSGLERFYVDKRKNMWYNKTRAYLRKVGGDSGSRKGVNVV